MNTSLLIAIVGCGVSLLSSLLIYLQHRRSGTPLSGYEVGAMLGSIGLLLVVAGASSVFEEGVSIALTLCGAPFAIGSAVLVSRARRQSRARGR